MLVLLNIECKYFKDFSRICPTGGVGSVLYFVEREGGENLHFYPSEQYNIQTICPERGGV
jgi:hypothetical protein